MHEIPFEELETLATEVLLAAGADLRNATCVANHLVLASLSGVDTHGILQLPRYVDEIRKGEILPRVRPKVVSTTRNAVLIRGNWTFGHVACQFAMEQGIKRAIANDIAVVGLVESGHIGRVGHYAELAARRGMIAAIWTGGYGVEVPAAMPYGGAERVLHTNPVAFGAPINAASTLNLDFATTAVSGTRVAEARRNHEALPVGAIADRYGAPSQDPEEFYAGGGLLPFGAHKGYALMVAAEFMGRLFTGADDYADAHRGGPTMRHQGVTMVVVRADVFQDRNSFTARATELTARIRAVKPIPGVEQVLVPGDLEAANKAKRTRSGIPVDDGLWEQLRALPRAHVAVPTGL